MRRAAPRRGLPPRAGGARPERGDGQDRGLAGPGRGLRRARGGVLGAHRGGRALGCREGARGGLEAGEGIQRGCGEGDHGRVERRGPARPGEDGRRHRGAAGAGGGGGAGGVQGRGGGLRGRRGRGGLPCCAGLPELDGGGLRGQAGGGRRGQEGLPEGRRRGAPGRGGPRGRAGGRGGRGGCPGGGAARGGRGLAGGARQGQGGWPGDGGGARAAAGRGRRCRQGDRGLRRQGRSRGGEHCHQGGEGDDAVHAGSCAEDLGRGHRGALQDGGALQGEDLGSARAHARCRVVRRRHSRRDLLPFVREVHAGAHDGGAGHARGDDGCGRLRAPGRGGLEAEREARRGDAQVRGCGEEAGGRVGVALAVCLGLCPARRHGPPQQPLRRRVDRRAGGPRGHRGRGLGGELGGGGGEERGGLRCAERHGPPAPLLVRGPPEGG
mmetsp:Transcript_46084/g.142541  ORF Transcript_46084/g.142541 Transcript_46084/m.142541 type:complete len:439 (-) Transcript_46084:539-1855(-)